MKLIKLTCLTIAPVLILATSCLAKPHRSGDIHWDYDRHQPCPEGYINCDAKSNCGRKADSCNGKHPEGDIFWDYDLHQPCPEGYINCDGKRNCGKKGTEETCK